MGGQPTYTHQVWRRSVKGPRSTWEQTNKRCSNYSMTSIISSHIVELLSIEFLVTWRHIHVEAKFQSIILHSDERSVILVKQCCNKLH